MKKILPVFFLVISILFLFAVSAKDLYATSTPAPSGPITQSTPTPPGTPSTIDERWIPDTEVTFVGKTATRSDDFLNWTLQNYDWLCVQKVNDSCNNANNPLIGFWKLVRNVVYALLVLFVLGTAFVMIITRGQNITVMRFIPRFIIVIILIWFSFAMIEFIYIASDIIQGFLLKPGGIQISSADLLHIAFDYNHFQGYRRIGTEFDESAFISLLLVRLTAFTYYTMTGILLIRKIILWFFIIVSPVFPLLLFYAPVRNTAKIWIGEFFRWLFYAPLFALFLHGLVILWQQGIPLPFSQIADGIQNNGCVRDDPYSCYPTAINILLGGPGQTIGIQNSVNLKDTFALYVVALLMLWVVILLPFLLLNIFLDYINTISLKDSWWIKNIYNKSLGIVNNRGLSPGPVPPGAHPPGPATTGMARILPFLKKPGVGATLPSERTTGAAISMPLGSTISSARSTTEIMNLTNLTIPKMRDIARYETSMISRDRSKTVEVSRLNSTLERIANPTTVTSTVERERLNQIKQKLVQQQQKGDPLATSILNATSVVSSMSSQDRRKTDISSLKSVVNQIAHPERITSTVERDRFSEIKNEIGKAEAKGDPLATTLQTAMNTMSQSTTSEQEKTTLSNTVHDKLVQEKEKGNPLATTILAETQRVSERSFTAPAGPSQIGVRAQQFAKQAATATRPAMPNLPVVNRVQQVSIEDYEEVKKLWQETYQSDVPPGVLDRRTWIKSDAETINQAISLLTSADSQKVNEGMQMVANILPFLMIGGFSRTEVIAYLKAKLEAGKSVLSDISKKTEEEETMLSREESHAQKEGHLTAAEELPGEDKKPKEISEQSFPGQEAKPPTETQEKKEPGEIVKPESEEKKDTT